MYTCTYSTSLSLSDSNATTSDSEAGQKEAEKKEKAPPTGRTVKLNLTAEFTVLDLPPPSSAEVDLSTAKLVHIFYSDCVYSTIDTLHVFVMMYIYKHSCTCICMYMCMR